MWKGFIQHQEDLLHERERKMKFTLAENTGLLDTLVEIGDRSTERYVFNANTMLNSKGKKLDPVDCVFLPTLSLKVSATPLLKPVRYSDALMIHFNLTSNIIFQHKKGWSRSIC